MITLKSKRMNSIRKLFIVLAHFLFWIPFLQGQSIDAELISNLGDYFVQNSTGSIEISVGEVVTETFDECILTNGFHQTFETTDCGFETTNVNRITSQDFDLFPNPTTGPLSLIIPQDQALTLNIFAASGKKMMTRSYDPTDQISLDLTALHNGIYYLELISQDIIYNKSFIKISEN